MPNACKEVHLVAQIKNDTPSTVIDTLRFMTGQGGLPSQRVSHPLFATQMWSYMLLSNDENYFIDEVNSHVRDRGHLGIVLTVNFSIIDYEGAIDLFLDWVKPYLHATCEAPLGCWRSSNKPVEMHAIFGRPNHELTRQPPPTKGPVGHPTPQAQQAAI